LMMHRMEAESNAENLLKQARSLVAKSTLLDRLNFLLGWGSRCFLGGCWLSSCGCLRCGLGGLSRSRLGSRSLDRSFRSNNRLLNRLCGFRHVDGSAKMGR
jgi:hypothetical protein